MKKIMEKLDLKDAAAFFPHLHIYEEDDEERREYGESVIKNICNYMNGMSRTREYDIYEVSMIRRAVRAEYLQRKVKKHKINSKSEEGKKAINEAIAVIANAYLKKDQVTVKDVELFKKCKLYEYESRATEAANR
jgi:hypothetical protein